MPSTKSSRVTVACGVVDAYFARLRQLSPVRRSAVLAEARKCELLLFHQEVLMLRSARTAPLIAAFAWSLVAVASAQLSQPNGRPIPTPRTEVQCNDSQDGSPGKSLLTVFACACDEPSVCNIGKPCPRGRMVVRIR